MTVFSERKSGWKRLTGVFWHCAMVVLLGIGASPVWAAPFFFPDMKPILIREESPEWLRDGKANDAYVTIASEVLPTTSCAQLSSRSFWGSDKTQLILSVVSNGFSSDHNKVEQPIAAFDGRDSGAECASLSAAPQLIVPLARLGVSSVFNPGHLSLVVNVKSANDSAQDFIGPVKLLLGSAAIVATGGSALAIGGVATTLGNPVIAEAQSRTNALTKGMIDAKVPITLSWSDLRQGLKSVEIAIYRTDQALGGISDKKIQQLQRDPNTDKEMLLKVRLDFQYLRSLFYPTAENIAHLAERENFSAERILNHKVPGKTVNFMQLLNDSSPSLLSRMGTAEGQNLARACSASFEKLKAAGLNNVDIAIVTKSFLDEAKIDPAWTGKKDIVKSCFGQAPAVLANFDLIYSTSTAE